MKKQKIVLIVEDEKDIREALRDVLVLRKTKVLEAKDGKEAIDISLTSHPDLILLDLLMPQIDGMTALKRIREDDWGRSVPVVILTNLNANNEQIVEDMITHKPLEYLIKSDWKIYDVVKKVEKILKI